MLTFFSHQFIANALIIKLKKHYYLINLGTLYIIVVTNFCERPFGNVNTLKKQVFQF